MRKDRKLLSEVDPWDRSQFMVLSWPCSRAKSTQDFSKANVLLICCMFDGQHSGKFCRNFALASARRTRISHARLTVEILRVDSRVFSDTAPNNPADIPRHSYPDPFSPLRPCPNDCCLKRKRALLTPETTYLRIEGEKRVQNT